MAPKKGKGKGGPVDGVDTTSMSREQLEAFSLRLREELDREREERNFFQLERDKLRTFWEITRQKLEENRAQLRNQDRAQDENEEKHQSEIKTYKQKVKHLLYENQCSLSDLKVERMVALKMAQDEYTAMENELLKDKNDLKSKLREQELAHQEVVRQLKMEQSQEVSRLREQFAQDSLELERKYEARLTTQGEELALQNSMELGEVEQRKNRQVVELTKSHEKAFNDMKNYYNEITLNNLALISSLKEQMEELKSGHERMEKHLREVQGENKRLTEPLKQAQTELANLQRQLASYEQDKITLANTKQRLALVTKELEDLRWENEVLELRFEKVEKERDRLHAEFVGAVLDVQQKTGLKSAMLEKKMSDLRGGSAVSDGGQPALTRLRTRGGARSAGAARPPVRRTCPRPSPRARSAVTELWSHASRRRIALKPQPPPQTQPEPQPQTQQRWSSSAQIASQRLGAALGALGVMGPSGPPRARSAVEGSCSELSSCSCLDAPRTVGRRDPCMLCEISGLRVQPEQCPHRTPSPAPRDPVPTTSHTCNHRCRSCRNALRKPDNGWVKSPKASPLASPKASGKQVSVKGSLKVSRNVLCSRAVPTKRLIKSASPRSGSGRLTTKRSAKHIASSTLSSAGNVVDLAKRSRQSSPCVSDTQERASARHARPSPTPPSPRPTVPPQRPTPRTPPSDLDQPSGKRWQGADRDRRAGLAPPGRLVGVKQSVAQIRLPTVSNMRQRQVTVERPPRAPPREADQDIYIAADSSIASTESVFFNASVATVRKETSARGSSRDPSPQYLSPRVKYAEGLTSRDPFPRGTPQVASPRSTATYGTVPKVIVTSSPSASKPPKSPKPSKDQGVRALSPSSMSKISRVGFRPSSWVKAPPRETTLSIVGQSSTLSPDRLSTADSARSRSWERHADCRIPSPVRGPLTPKSSPRQNSRISRLRGSESIETLYLGVRRHESQLDIATEHSFITSIASRQPSLEDDEPVDPALRMYRVRRSYAETSLPPADASRSRRDLFSSERLSETKSGDLGHSFSQSRMADAATSATSSALDGAEMSPPLEPYSSECLAASTPSTQDPPLTADQQWPRGSDSCIAVNEGGVFDKSSTTRPEEQGVSVQTSPRAIAEPRDASVSAALPDTADKASGTGDEISAHKHVCDVSCEVRLPSVISEGTSSYSVGYTLTKDRETETEVKPTCDRSCEAKIPSVISDSTSMPNLPSVRDSVSEASESIFSFPSQRRVSPEHSKQDIALSSPPTIAGTSTPGKRFDVRDPAGHINAVSAPQQSERESTRAEVTSFPEETGARDLSAVPVTVSGGQQSERDVRDSPHIRAAVSVTGVSPSISVAVTDSQGSERVVHESSSIRVTVTSPQPSEQDLRDTSVPKSPVSVPQRVASHPSSPPSVSAAGRATADSTVSDLQRHVHESVSKVTVTASASEPHVSDHKDSAASKHSESEAHASPSALQGSVSYAPSSRVTSIPESPLPSSQHPPAPKQSQDTRSSVTSRHQVEGEDETIQGAARNQQRQSQSSSETGKAERDEQQTLSGLDMTSVVEDVHEAQRRPEAVDKYTHRESGSSAESTSTIHRQQHEKRFSSISEDSPHRGSFSSIVTAQELASKVSSSICLLSDEFVDDDDVPQVATDKELTSRSDAKGSVDSRPATHICKSGSHLPPLRSRSETRIRQSQDGSQSTDKTSLTSSASQAASGGQPSLTKIVDAATSPVNLARQSGSERDVVPSSSKSAPRDAPSQKAVVSAATSASVMKRGSLSKEVSFYKQLQSLPTKSVASVGVSQSGLHLPSALKPKASIHATITTSVTEQSVVRRTSSGRKLSAAGIDVCISVSSSSSDEEDVDKGTATRRNTTKGTERLQPRRRRAVIRSLDDLRKEFHPSRERLFGIAPSKTKLQSEVPTKEADVTKSESREEREGNVKMEAQPLTEEELGADVKPIEKITRSRTTAKTKSQGTTGRIKDWLRGLTHGRSQSRRLSVQTSTSDLSESSTCSRKDLFKKDRHTSCFDSPSSHSRPHVAASSSSKMAASKSRSRLSFFSRLRKQRRSSQHSVRFDFDDSDTEISSQSCHMATCTSPDKDIGRARSLPQLPRRGGLKRSLRSGTDRRARCRSEGRFSSKAADDVVTSPTVGRMVHDRHLQCYEDRSSLPPLPRTSRYTTSHGGASAAIRARQRGPDVRTASRQTRGAIQKSGKRAKREKRRMKTNVTRSSDSMVSSSVDLPEKAVIWTKPGKDVDTTSAKKSTMWLMFPSIVTTRKDQVSSQGTCTSPPPKDVASKQYSDGLVSPVREGTRERYEISFHPGTYTEAQESSGEHGLSSLLDEDLSTPAPCSQTDDQQPSCSGTRRSPIPSSSSEESPVPQVLSPPLSSTPYPSWQKDRITIQEISSDDMLFEEAGVTVPATGSRLSCLQEETDSDVNLESVAVQESFLVTSPLRLSESQEDVRLAVETTLSPSKQPFGGGQGAVRRRAALAHSPRRRISSSQDDGEGPVEPLVSRGRRCLRSKHSSARSAPATPAAPRPSSRAVVTPPTSPTPSLVVTLPQRTALQDEKAPVTAIGTASPSSSRVPKVRFSEERRTCAESESHKSTSEVLESPQQEDARSIIPLPSPGGAASLHRKPTRIRASRAKSTASLTGLHNVDQAGGSATIDSPSLSRILRPPGREVTVIELFRRQPPRQPSRPPSRSPQNPHDSRSSSS